jgi:arabinogalactan endo-1,4-beta-galactosidase
MEIKSVTYYGWRDNLQTVEKRITYDYPKGNDVTVVEQRSYLVTLYDGRGNADTFQNKGNNIDQMA